MRPIPCPFHRTDEYIHSPILLSKTSFSTCSKSTLTTACVGAYCSNRGILSASCGHYTVLKAWRPTMPRPADQKHIYKLGVALTYLSNTTIKAVPLCFSHITQYSLEVTFSLRMFSMTDLQHPRSPSSQLTRWNAYSHSKQVKTPYNNADCIHN